MGFRKGACWEAGQTWSFRGSKSCNKVSVGEPAEGSLASCVEKGLVPFYISAGGGEWGVCDGCGWIVVDATVSQHSERLSRASLLQHIYI